MEEVQKTCHGHTKKKSMSEEFKDGFMKDMQCVVLLKDEYGFDRWSGGGSTDRREVRMFQPKGRQNEANA